MAAIKGFILKSFVNGHADGINSSLDSLYGELGVSDTAVFDSCKDSFIMDLYKASEGSDVIMLGHSDSPWYCSVENKRLMKNFLDNDCDYGFGDNFPKGVVLEILRREVLPVMENLRKSKNISISRELFQDIMHIDVNMFDLENLYAEKDLRTLRLSFFADSRQNRFLLDRIAEMVKEKKWNSDLNFNSLADTVLSNRDRLRTIPAYVEIDCTTRILERSVCKPLSLLDGVSERDMSLADFNTVIDKVASFTPEAHIALAGTGDAGCHPQVIEMIEAVIAKGQPVILETSGAAMTRELADRILSLDDKGLLSVIFLFDALDKDLYAKLSPSEVPYETVLENIEYLLLRRKQNTWVQTVKMKDNFENLVPLHKHFKKFTDNIIIQKYNTYRGLLPERRYNPMQPFEKIDCWHLKRDLYIGLDGTVRLCKHDLRNEHSSGNLLTDGIEDIYAKGDEYLQKHCKGWDFCNNCDEYYTYNF